MPTTTTMPIKPIKPINPKKPIKPINPKNPIKPINPMHLLLPLLIILLTSCKTTTPTTTHTTNATSLTASLFDTLSILSLPLPFPSGYAASQYCAGWQPQPALSSPQAPAIPAPAPIPRPVLTQLTRHATLKALDTTTTATTAATAPSDPLYRKISLFNHNDFWLTVRIIIVTLCVLFMFKKLGLKLINYGKKIAKGHKL